MTLAEVSKTASAGEMVILVDKFYTEADAMLKKHVEDGVRYSKQVEKVVPRYLGRTFLPSIMMPSTPTSFLVHTDSQTITACNQVDYADRKLQAFNQNLTAASKVLNATSTMLLTLGIEVPEANQDVVRFL